MEKKRKKLSKKQTRLRMTGLIVLGLFLIGMLLFLFLFRVGEVEVEGNIHYTAEEIEAMVMERVTFDNTVVLSLIQKEIVFEDVPFLHSVQIQLKGHDSIKLRVNEKSVIGYVEYADEYWYFNREGIVVERCTTPAMTAEERIAREENEKLRSEAESQGVTMAVAELPVKNFVPEVRGFSFTEVVLGKQLPVEDDSIFNTLYSMNQMMNKDNIPADFVLFDEEYNVYLFYGNIEVRLGQDDHLEDKMTALASIMPEMTGLSGTLHLEKYENIQNGVVFKKSE